MTKTKYQIPCQKIISGGQTGVDRGALDASLANNFRCGGWCPKGRIAEDGVIENKYPLKETSETEYDARTRKNILESDGTMIIANKPLSGGTLLTYEFAKGISKPVLVIHPQEKNENKSVLNTINWIKENSITILNIAGPRQSEWKNAYDIAFKITSAIIYEIDNSAG